MPLRRAAQDSRAREVRRITLEPISNDEFDDEWPYVDERGIVNGDNPWDEIEDRERSRHQEAVCPKCHTVYVCTSCRDVDADRPDDLSSEQGGEDCDC